jgi:Heavy metal binding domain
LKAVKHLAIVAAFTCVVSGLALAQAPSRPPNTPNGMLAQSDKPTESIWSCPVHAVVAEQNPGKCPICRRDLVIVTATVSWICSDRPEVERPAPGKCADGSQAEKRYVQSTHANHNPRHGGLFFMAPDLWHHLEGTYQSDEIFRVYLYDDYTRPLSADLAKQVTGRIVTKETFDAATRTTKEISAFPLRPSADGEYLEGRPGRMKLPADMTAKLKFKSGDQEYRFDFTFGEFSVDKAATPGDVAASLFEVPDDLNDVLKLLDERVTLIGDLVRKGAFSEVWVPAFQAKDLALALDARTRTLPPAKRAVATAGVERLVRAAWVLDAAGDTGNRSEVEQGYSAFASAARELGVMFRPSP